MVHAVVVDVARKTNTGETGNTYALVSVTLLSRALLAKKGFATQMRESELDAEKREKRFATQMRESELDAEKRETYTQRGR